MWFRFPKGTDQITVEQQNFTMEHKDKDGNQFFRAPDHFAPTILGLGGFARVERPEGAPEDLAPVDPERAEATDKLAAQVGSLEEENQLLRQQLGEARRERDETRTRLDDAIAKLEMPTADAPILSKPREEPRHASQTPSRSAENKPAGR